MCFHEYRKIWSPKFGQKLNKRQKINLFDPYAMGLYGEIKWKIENLTADRHFPREISRFCKYFVEYNGELDLWVRSTNFRRNSLPQGDVEIVIKFQVGKGKAGFENFRKIKGFVLDNYLKPEKILLDKKTEEEDEVFLLFKFLD